ncbi:MAG TPA: hypothetical protein VG317_07370 [Pseudonocardiaceae bacterium]|nr:hypothetical protein [Pseudonocardiaceae bacterium]
MIRADRELLARLTRTNTRLGDVVIELINRQDSGQIAAEGWRALGEHLAGLGADMIRRADELDAARVTVLDAGDRP